MVYPPGLRFPINCNSLHSTMSSARFLAGTAIWATSSASTVRSSTASAGKTRSKALHEFKLHRQEKFLYICDTLHMWEWDVRVVDIQAAGEGDELPLCVSGRGAAPPELCGGPTGYWLMIKRQREGAAMSDPVRTDGPNTFRPMRVWLNGQTSPEML